MRGGLLCDGGRISLVCEGVHYQTEMLDKLENGEERREIFQHLLVRHQTQWVDLCHQDTGGDHVELDVDQEGTENIPDEGVSTQSSLQMEYYNITILRVKGIIEGHDMRDWLSS